MSGKNAGEWVLFIAAGMVLLLAVVSAGLRIGLSRPLLIAAVRTTLQLLLIGFA